MKGSIYIGRIAGIKILIHWTFLLLIFWIVFSGLRRGNDTGEIVFRLAFTAAVFVCIVLHELGHAITAKRFNFKTRDITLLPIGGLARMEGLPEKPGQELLVAIMGPVVNFVIAGVLYVTLKFYGVFPVSINDLSITRVNFWFQLYAVNIFLGLFNLIPAFPMDGGRVLRALLAIRLSRAKATRIAAYIGQTIAVVFTFFGFLYNPILVLIGIFIFLGARAEYNMERTKSILHNIKVKDLVMKHFSVLHPSEPLSKAVDILLDSQEKSFIVKDDGEVKGVLSEKEIISGLARFGKDIPVQQVMQTKVVSLHEQDNINEVMQSFSDGSDTLMPVFNGKEITGVLNLENIREFVETQAALKLINVEEGPV